MIKYVNLVVYLDKKSHVWDFIAFGTLCSYILFPTIFFPLPISSVLLRILLTSWWTQKWTMKKNINKTFKMYLHSNSFSANAKGNKLSFLQFSDFICFSGPNFGNMDKQMIVNENLKTCLKLPNCIFIVSKYIVSLNLFEVFDATKFN